MFSGNVYTSLKAAKAFLKSKGFSECKSDVEVLLSFVLRIKRSSLPLIRDRKLTYRQMLQYEEYIFRRSLREPVAYIIGFVGFMNFEFKVNKNVFIPRPETELLVEAVLELKETENKTSVLDLCTGSGCIAISLAKLGGFKNITALDVNRESLNIAKENAKINSILDINFIESSLFNSTYLDKFDVIVSNPPYISEIEYAFLEPELRYEPKIALMAKDDGLFFYKKISRNAMYYLNKEGFILVELNSNKYNEIKQVFLNNNYRDIEIMNDYSGLPRVLKAKLCAL
jgi:release factor glutamine methyltransferase